MNGIIERAEAMLTTLAYAQSKGIAQAYPDSSVTIVVSDLLAALKAERAENERLRSGYSEWENCTCPASTLFSGSVGRDCPTHGGIS